MLGPEKDLERKLREAVMAVQLEHRYSKQTILERYLNTIYFGNGAYGVQAAAHRYFSKDVGALDLAQSALLAGVIRSPETYNPFTAPEQALARRNEVLDRLDHLHRVPAADVAAAKVQPLGLAPPPADGRYPAPYFVAQVSKLVLRRPGLRRDPGAAPPPAARGRPADPHHARPEAAGARRGRDREGARGPDRPDRRARLARSRATAR